MKTTLGKILIGTAVGAGALGVGFGASMAVASAATTHPSLLVDRESATAAHHRHSRSLTVHDA